MSHPLIDAREVPVITTLGMAQRAQLAHQSISPPRSRRAFVAAAGVVVGSAAVLAAAGYALGSAAGQ